MYFCKKSKAFPGLLLVLVLGGCASQANVAGQPQTLPEIREKQSESSLAEKRNTSQYTYVDQQKRSQWRNQLPELTQDAADYRHQPDEAEAVAAPTPRIAEKNRQGIGHLSTESYGSTVKASQESEQTVNSTAEHIYTVQLGAFSSESAMHTYIEENGLTALEGWKSETFHKDGKQWYVIIWGQFDTRQEAELAWIQQQQKFPIVNYWIRTVNTLSQEKYQIGT